MGWFNRCCKAQNKKCSKDLEVVTLGIEKNAALKNLDHIKDGMKICTLCRDFLSETEDDDDKEETTDNDDKEESKDDENASNISIDEQHNEEEDRTSGIESETASHKDQYNVKDIKKNPVAKSMSSCHVNIKRLKSENIQKAISPKRKRYNIILSSSSEDDDDDLPLKSSDNYSDALKAKYFDEIMKQVKSAYRNTNNRTTKMQLLTVVPKSWDATKIQQEFGTTMSLARQAKKNSDEKGILFYNSKLD